MLTAPYVLLLEDSSNSCYVLLVFTLVLVILQLRLATVSEDNFIFVFRNFKVLFSWGNISPNDISTEVVSSIQNQIGIILFCAQIKISGNFTCFLISLLKGIKYTNILRNPLQFFKSKYMLYWLNGCDFSNNFFVWCSSIVGEFIDFLKIKIRW